MNTGARVSLGVALVLHGLAHALPGRGAADAVVISGGPRGSLWIATVLWAAAMAGLLAAGAGLLGAAPLARI